MLIGAFACLIALVVAPVAPAKSEPRGFEGAFELSGTHGYTLRGFVTDTFKSGQLMLFVDKRGAGVTYAVHGKVTEDHVHFDLGRLGEVDFAVIPTHPETVSSGCGKALPVEGKEYVGTLDFHGEEGFTEAEATALPLSSKLLLEVICGGVSSSTLGGHGVVGVQLNVTRKGGPSLQLNQNHHGARVFYEANVSEKEGGVRVKRAVVGRLAGGALTYSPSLGAASFSAAAPFSGSANYIGKRPPLEFRPGKGSWGGNLKVDFPGKAAVPLAGPSFTASITHAERTEYRH